MAPLRIERIETGVSETVIGIAELRNLNGLSQSELIDLATSRSIDSLTVQFLNGLLIADEIHLLSATQNAINAQQGEYMLSRSLDVEIIVFASAQRQIGKALTDLGVYDNLNEIAVVVVGPDATSVEGTIRDLADKVGEETIPPFPCTNERIERVKRHYQITEKEIDTISDSDKIESRLAALSRCLVSRVSLVAFDS